MNNELIKLEKSILDKVSAFENTIIQKRLEKIDNDIILKDVNYRSSLIFLFNNILAGVCLGKLVSTVLIPSVKTNFFYAVFLGITTMVSSVYINNYLSKDKNKETIKKEIKVIESLKDLKRYITILPLKFYYMNLIVNKENLNKLKEEIGQIDYEDMKMFIKQLTNEELHYIIKLLQKNNNEISFSINIINDIKKLCKKQKSTRKKEENLLNIIKEMKNSNSQEDDLLEAMLQECNLNEDNSVSKKHNFKNFL